MGGGTGSSSKRRKSSKKKTDKKKKYKVKESKRRRHDSVSSFSDDDSYGSESSSSDYRRKSKKSKKRIRRDSSVSPYSDDDGHVSIRKSRKTSRSLSKRDRKRYSSSESYGDARRVRKAKRKRLSGEDVGKSKKRKRSSTKKSKKYLRSSSPDSLSCSTCPGKSSSSTGDGKNEMSKPILDKEADVLMGGRGGEESFSDGQNDVELLPVSNSRRLRSVIAVAYQPDEDDRWESNPSKEEIVNELDGYPSPISPDSNGETNERDSINPSRGISSTEIQVEHAAADHGAGDARTNTLEEDKDTGVSVPTAALAGDDLESILRQKALENLKKFKGGLQTTPRKMMVIKTSNTNDVLNKSTIHDPDMQLRDQRTELILGKDSSSTEANELPESEKVNVELRMSVQTNTHSTNSLTEHVEENLRTSSTDVLKKDSNPGTRAADVPSSSILEPVSSSSPRPNSEKHTLDEQQDEAKDGPEFEQKTMTVMRGGELVQVTYKVKIPKRAPALARRNFRR